MYIAARYQLSGQPAAVELELLQLFYLAREHGPTEQLGGSEPEGMFHIDAASAKFRRPQLRVGLELGRERSI